MSLSKEDILTANDPNLLEVQVPEWRGSVFLRVMTVGERDRYELEWNRTNGEIPDFRTKFLACCLADAKGKRLFTDAEITELCEKSSKVMHRLWRAAMDHNDLSEPKVEEAAKNS